VTPLIKKPTLNIKDWKVADPFQNLLFRRQFWGTWLQTSLQNEMSRDIVLTSRQMIVAWTWQCYGRCFIVRMSISQIGGIELLQKKLYHEPIWKLGQIKNVGLCHVPYM
jgi:hypothetical protein